MNFYSAYLRTLFWKPQDAIVAMYWWCTGRKVRARNRLRMVAEQSPFAYQMWIDTVEREQDKAVKANPTMAGWQLRPRISVILYDRSLPGNDDLVTLLASLDAQHYPDWELVVVPDRASEPPPQSQDRRIVVAAHGSENAAEALARGVDLASGSYVLPLPKGAVLPARALFRYVEKLQSHPDARVIYGDQDLIDTHGTRSTPWFKPHWNGEMFLAQDYLSAACIVETRAALAALRIPVTLADAASYALLLAVTRPEKLAEAVPAEVVHMPHILAHLPERAQAANQAARVAAVANHLGPTAAAASAGPFASVRVDWPLPEPPPLVSIIIPTRDQFRLLRKCVAGVLTATRYRNFEIIIVNNDSHDPATLAYLSGFTGDPRHRVLAYDRPFNYSAINNFAVRHARGSYLCLLNNDIEIVDDDWLGALMRQAVRPEVGAAGAKLLYPNRTIQHAGVVIGLNGSAGHAHRFHRDHDAGYFSRVHVAHRTSAVTAACLVVEKFKFEAVGGFDEAGLAIAFNDVDLCLKLDRAGWHNIYVPQAIAIHHESMSRGRDFRPAHIDRYRRELAVLQERWGTPNYRDPLHHPHLDKCSETYLVHLKV